MTASMRRQALSLREAYGAEGGIEKVYLWLMRANRLCTGGAMELRVELKKSFDGFSLDVGLTLREDLIVLFGPSGAGKSQILKMISGIVRPDEGLVSVGGERVFYVARGGS